MEKKTGSVHVAGLVALMRRRCAYLLDAGIAGLVLAITISVPPEDARAFDALGLVLAAIVSLPLVARRREPLAVCGVIGSASTVLVWLGYVEGSAPGMLVALYSVAVRPPSGVRASRVGATAAGLFLLHMLAMNEAMATGYLGAPFFALFWAAAWLIGDVIRQRQQTRARDA